MTRCARAASVAAMAAVLALSTLAWSPPAIGAQPEVTCAGEPATHVGSREKTHLAGTPERDVMVTNGSLSVDAFEGDDLICITGKTEDVEAGPGDDDVRTLPSADGWRIRVWLGPGSDHFAGGAAGEEVNADDGSTVDDPDVVRTGGGRDEVSSGEQNTDLVDVIDLGWGNDRLRLVSRTAAATFSVTGSAGFDELELWPWMHDGLGNRPWLVDNRASVGHAGFEGRTTMSWTSFERFGLEPPARSWSFLGGPSDETVDVKRLRSAQMGGGDDRVQVLDVPRDTRMRGGSGTDTVAFNSMSILDCPRTATVRMAVGTYSCAGPDPGPGSSESSRPDRRASFSGFESAVASGRRVVMVGSRHDDRLVAIPDCVARVRAGGGDDQVILRGVWSTECGPDYPVRRLAGAPATTSSSAGSVVTSSSAGPGATAPMDEPTSTAAWPSAG